MSNIEDNSLKVTCWYERETCKSRTYFDLNNFKNPKIILPAKKVEKEMSISGTDSLSPSSSFSCTFIDHNRCSTPKCGGVPNMFQVDDIQPLSPILPSSNVQKPLSLVVQKKEVHSVNTTSTCFNWEEFHEDFQSCESFKSLCKTVKKALIPPLLLLFGDCHLPHDKIDIVAIELLMFQGNLTEIHMFLLELLEMEIVSFM